MNSKHYISTSVAIATASLLAVAGVAVIAPALAQAQTVQASVQTAPTNGAPAGMHGWSGGMGMGMRGGMKPGIFGTVSAVNGTTLTVSGKQGFGSTTTATTFTVDASNATVRKDNATSTVSSIAVGDTVMVQGTVSGTSVTATMIRDGVMPMRGNSGGPGGMGRGGMASSTRSMPASPITGNGQPVIAGSVSAVNGSSLTVTNKSNVTYTVDASNAKIVQGQTTISVASISVGDNVIVQGAVNGTSVTASSVIDQKAPASGSATASSGHAQPHSAGIFGAIGQFFSHIFGF